MSEVNFITLTSSDNQSLKVEKQVAMQSGLLKNMLEDIEQDNTPIPLPNVSGKILQKVVEYCTHHKNDEPYPEEEDRDSFDPNNKKDKLDAASDWDKQFVSVENDELFEIILAANYLDIKSLLDLGCKTVANMIRGKSPQQIRDLFNIENDFTPEEEEQIRRENEWAADA